MRNGEAGSLGRGSQAETVGDLSRGAQSSHAPNHAESGSDLKVTQYSIFILKGLKAWLALMSKPTIWLQLMSWYLSFKFSELNLT